MRHYSTQDEMRKLDDRKGREVVMMPVYVPPVKKSMWTKFVDLLLFKETK